MDERSISIDKMPKAQIDIDAEEKAARMASLVSELSEVRGKIARANTFLRLKGETISSHAADLLAMQVDHMIGYANILHERIVLMYKEECSQITWK